MKTIFKTKLISLITILGSSVLLFTASARAAGSATFSLSPASGTYESGNSLVLTLTEDSGSTAINALDIKLNISSADASKIQFTGIDGTGTSFTSFSANYTATTAHFVSYVQPASLGGPGTLTGSHKVGTLNLSVKTIDASTSGSVTFDASSGGIANAADNSDVWDHNTAGATFTLNPKPSTGGGGTGGGGTHSGSGGSSSSSSSSSSTKIVPSPSEQQSNPTAPVPASTQSTTATGYYVTIKVVDDKGKPIKDATVKLGNSSVKSDSTGLASFANIAPGIYKLTVKSGNLQSSTTINVDGTQPTTTVQQFEVKLKAKYNIALIASIAGGVILVIIVLIILKNRNNRFKPLNHPGYEVPKAVIGGAEPATPAAPTNTAATVKPAASQSNDNLLKPTVITPGKTIGPESKA